MSAVTAGRRITVALSSDFLSAMARIPRNQQRKVIEFIEKFRSDPTRSGINYEKIKHAKDPNLRSVRIDQAYRGIVLKPETGNVYVLVWVDHHDDAYGWARNRLLSIHPQTGSLQVINTEEVAPGAQQADQRGAAGLFAEFRDRNLTGLGVPEALLPLVRSLTTRADLDRAADYLPQEAYEALFWLAEGESLEEVHRAMERPEEVRPVDTGDFEGALKNPDSKRRFVVAGDDEELAAILSDPLEKWRVFLHPMQRKLVERAWKGPLRVLGGAGTGKTVVAMHHAKWLADNVFTGGDDRILFTTFTRNLAADIQGNIQRICSDDLMRRIEVRNLDRWVSEFLRKGGYDSRIVYDAETSPLWDLALTVRPGDLDHGAAFYREEWNLVVQPQSVDTLEQYLKASRVGRGVRLNRRARKQVWPVFEEYRTLLSDRGWKESVDAMRDARLLLEGQGAVLPYRAVIVDEAQDMGYQAFRLIRAMLPADDDPPIFIVGDAHQRIYRKKVVLYQCGINIRGRRGRKLRTNYRTTEQTRRWAVRLLEGVPIDDLDGGSDDQKGYVSLLRGPEPRLEALENFTKEVEAIAAFLKDLDERELASACLVARTNRGLDAYGSALEGHGLRTYRVRRSEADDRRAPGLRLATMHRVKGLEFDRVIIAGVNQGTVPLEVMSDSSDPVVARDHEVNERALLYVAATRARRELLLTSHGTPSPFLRS